MQTLITEYVARYNERHFSSPIGAHIFTSGTTVLYHMGKGERITRPVSAADALLLLKTVLENDRTF